MILVWQSILCRDHVRPIALGPSVVPRARVNSSKGPVHACSEPKISTRKPKAVGRESQCCGDGPPEGGGPQDPESNIVCLLRLLHNNTRNCADKGHEELEEAYPWPLR